MDTIYKRTVIEEINKYSRDAAFYWRTKDEFCVYPWDL